MNNRYILQKHVSDENVLERKGLMCQFSFCCFMCVTMCTKPKDTSREIRQTSGLSAQCHEVHSSVHIVAEVCSD